MSPNDRKWFLLNEGKVFGPFAKAEVDQKIITAPDCMIWGRGQSDWVPFERWNRLLLELDESGRNKHQQQPSRLWKIKDAGHELKPMTHDQMIDHLKTMTDLGEVLLWTEGYSEWKEIYQIHKIMDELGVSRRAHPRVPIMGTLNCEGATGSFNARVLSISEGGLGITESPPVKIGEKFKTILKSPNLFTAIHATAEIVYVGEDNYAGLKFVGLHSESKSAIIEYVKKFQETKVQAPGQ